MGISTGQLLQLRKLARRAARPRRVFRPKTAKAETLPKYYRPPDTPPPMVFTRDDLDAAIELVKDSGISLASAKEVIRKRKRQKLGAG